LLDELRIASPFCLLPDTQSIAAVLGGDAKQPPSDELRSTHFLADGAQPCGEPHGFVAVFDWFNLVFKQK
jgi:hypothetical protein